MLMTDQRLFVKKSQMYEWKKEFHVYCTRMYVCIQEYFDSFSLQKKNQKLKMQQNSLRNIYIIFFFLKEKAVLLM